MSKIRSFIAINLPTAARRALESNASAWAGVSDQVKWVRPYQYHFTLAFLGDVEQKQLEVIGEALPAVIADMSPFSIEVAGFGAFPSVERAKVIWLGVQEGAAGLQEIYNRIWPVLGEYGFTDDGSFHPHLTLGRVKSSAGYLSVARYEQDFQGKVWTHFPVRGLSIMKSELTSKGPKHTELSVMPLLGEE